jgi:hypothetical protein
MDHLVFERPEIAARGAALQLLKAPILKEADSGGDIFDAIMQ